MITDKRILVTGAGGFIGGYLARQLLKQGNYVAGVDIKPLAEWEIATGTNNYVRYDLTDADKCKRLLYGEDIDYIFHLAANMGGIGYITKKGAEIVHDNQIMNLNMLEAARKCNVPRFFFSSSACVYPEELQQWETILPLIEHDAIPAHPDTAYGWEKLMMEEEMRAYKNDYGLEVRIARYHNIFGPAWHSDDRDKAPAAICKKVIRAKDGGEIEIWGDGRQTRSFLYVDDCVDASLRLMEGYFDQPINIGSDRSIDINDLTKMIIEISGKNLTIKNVPGVQGVRGRNANINLIKVALGWTPKVTLEEGMKLLYRYLEKRENNGI